MAKSPFQITKPILIEDFSMDAATLAAPFSTGDGAVLLNSSKTTKGPQSLRLQASNSSAGTYGRMQIEGSWDMTGTGSDSDLVRLNVACESGELGVDLSLGSCARLLVSSNGFTRYGQSPYAINLNVGPRNEFLSFVWKKSDFSSVGGFNNTDWPNIVRIAVYIKGVQAPFYADLTLDTLYVAGDAMPCITWSCDDGLDDAESVISQLAAHDINTTLAINHSTLGTAGHMTLAAVQAHHANGNKVINKGLDGVVLVDGVNEADVKADILAGRAAIDADFPNSPAYVAYAGDQYNQEIKTFLRQNGVTQARAGQVYVDPQYDPAIFNFAQSPREYECMVLDLSNDFPLQNTAAEVNALLDLAVEYGWSVHIRVRELVASSPGVGQFLTSEFPAVVAKVAALVSAGSVKSMAWHQWADEMGFVSKGMWIDGIASFLGAVNETFQEFEPIPAFLVWFQWPESQELTDAVVSQAVRGGFTDVTLTVKNTGGMGYEGSTAWGTAQEIIDYAHPYDPYLYMLDQCAAAGIKVRAAFSMAKSILHDGTGGYPDWRRTDDPDYPDTRVVDFTIVAARDAMVDSVEEVLLRYGDKLFGVDLDFIRTGLFEADPAEVLINDANVLDVVTRIKALVDQYLPGRELRAWGEHDANFNSQGNKRPVWLDSGAIDVMLEPQYRTPDAAPSWNTQGLADLFGDDPVPAIAPPADTEKILLMPSFYESVTTQINPLTADEFHYSLLHRYGYSEMDDYNIFDVTTSNHELLDYIAVVEDPQPTVTYFADIETNQDDVWAPGGLIYRNYIDGTPSPGDGVYVGDGVRCWFAGSLINRTNDGVAVKMSPDFSKTTDKGTTIIVAGFEAFSDDYAQIEIHQTTGVISVRRRVAGAAEQVISSDLDYVLDDSLEIEYRYNAAESVLQCRNLTTGRFTLDKLPGSTTHAKQAIWMVGARKGNSSNGSDFVLNKYAQGPGAAVGAALPATMDLVDYGITDADVVLQCSFKVNPANVQGSAVFRARARNETYDADLGVDVGTLNSFMYDIPAPDRDTLVNTGSMEMVIDKGFPCNAELPGSLKFSWTAPVTIWDAYETDGDISLILDNGSPAPPLMQINELGKDDQIKLVHTWTETIVDSYIDTLLVRHTENRVINGSTDFEEVTAGGSANLNQGTTGYRFNNVQLLKRHQAVSPRVFTSLGYLGDSLMTQGAPPAWATANGNDLAWFPGNGYLTGGTSPAPAGNFADVGFICTVARKVSKAGLWPNNNVNRAEGQGTVSDARVQFGRMVSVDGIVPQVMVCGLGTNDAIAATVTATYESEYQALIDELAAEGVQQLVILETVSMANDPTYDTETFRNRLDAYNGVHADLVAYAESVGIYAQLDRRFDRFGGHSPISAWFQPGDLHFNITGSYEAGCSAGDLVVTAGLILESLISAGSALNIVSDAVSTSLVYDVVSNPT